MYVRDVSQPSLLALLALFGFVCCVLYYLWSRRQFRNEMARIDEEAARSFEEITEKLEASTGRLASNTAAIAQVQQRSEVVLAQARQGIERTRALISESRNAMANELAGLFNQPPETWGSSFTMSTRVTSEADPARRAVAVAAAISRTGPERMADLFGGRGAQLLDPEQEYIIREDVTFNGILFSQGQILRHDDISHLGWYRFPVLDHIPARTLHVLMGAGFMVAHEPDPASIPAPLDEQFRKAVTTPLPSKPEAPKTWYEHMMEDEEDDPV